MQSEAGEPIGFVRIALGWGEQVMTIEQLVLAPSAIGQGYASDAVWGAAGLDGRRVDAIFAIAMIVELQLESWLDNGVPDSHQLLTAVASLFFAAPIAVRRRSPSLALLFCLAVVVIQTPLGGNPQR